MKKRILSIVLALAMYLSMLPPVALAAEADGTGLCPHHTEHTAGCGYIAPTEGQLCSHEHTAECYTLGVLPGTDDAYTVSEDTGNLLDCTHAHDGTCGYVPADPGHPCEYECHICPVQALIDALPDAGDITTENVPEVEAQLTAIDEARAALTDEELDQLDTRRYENAVSALLALEGMAGADAPQPLAGEIAVDSTTTTWTDGTYTVSSNVEIADRIKVSGTVTLVLNAGCKLTASKGIAVTAGNSLTIEGEGTLEAKGGTSQAGIGGNYQSETGGATGGTIRITGGTIIATGGGAAAGIGGGNNDDGSSPASGGTIEISGGTVKATGNFGGAGIGGGSGSSSAVGGAGGTITISGNAHVEAIGDWGGAGIGGGSSGSQNGGDGGTITISGNAHVEATGGNAGAGIGGGSGSSGGSAGTIQIGGGAHVKATGGSSGGAGVGGNGGEITIDGDGTYVEAIGIGNSAGIGGYSIGKAEITVTIHGGEVKASGGAGIGGGYGSGSTGAVKVEIDGGTIDATGGDSSGAGIGSGSSATGPVKVTISGGTITATGGSSRSGGAGVGSGGLATSTVEVIINGGTIAATGGGSTTNLSGGGAGIGSGGKSTGTATVTIGGGTVTATGGSSTGTSGVGGAGIGAGGRGSSATFSTGEGGSAWIVANGGSSSSGQGAGIGDASNQGSWSGVIFQNGAGELYGGKYSLSTAAVAAEVPSGATLAIPAEAFLTVENGTALTVDGTINNSGTLTVCGTLDGSGTLSGGGKFYTTNVTADMITVPTGLFYEDKDWIDYIGQKTTLATKTYCGKEFQVTGWTQSVTKVSDLEYTVTYTPDSSIGGTAITKNVTLGKSGTNLTAELKDGKTDYNYGETITITGTVGASGEAPMTASLNSLTPPSAGQVAVYDKDGKQVSEPGTMLQAKYTLTVDTKTLGAGTHELTVKFIASTVMAEATLTVNIKVAECTHPGMTDGKCTECGETIVAQVEASGTTTLFTDITKAWAAADTGGGATVTMLTSATTTEDLEMKKGGTITLTMKNDVTLTSEGTNALKVAGGGTLKLEKCTINAENAMRVVCINNGTVELTDCKITGSTGRCICVLPGRGMTAKAIVHSGTFSGRYGLDLDLGGGGEGTAELRGGTFQPAGSFSPAAIHISTKVVSDKTAGDLLAEGYGYKKTAGGWVTDLSQTDITDEVTVTRLPVEITAQPQAPAAVEYGYTSADAPKVTVTAAPTTAGAAITYQWYKLDGETPTEITGQTANILTVPTGWNAGSYQVYCVATCDQYPLKSDTVTVTVNKAPLTITGATLAERDYAPGDTSATVTGVTFDKATLALGTDFTASAVYDDANAGTGKNATITVTLKDTATAKNYTLTENTCSATGTINAKTVTADVTVTPDKYEYTGSAITPTEVEVKDGTTLIPASEYTVTYQNNTNHGAATVTITDNAGGNYTVNGSATFEITKPLLDTAEVMLAQTTFTYDGTAQTPEVTVTKGSKVLTKDTDYTVTYTNNTNAGANTASVTVNGINNYEGEKTVNFTISPKPVTAVVTAENRHFDGTRNATVTAEIKSGDLANGDNITITGLTGTFDSMDVGTGKTVTVDSSNAVISGNAQGNYTITIPPTTTADIERATVKITWSATSQSVEYTGAPAAIVDPSVTAENGVTVSVDPEYSYAKQGENAFSKGLPTNAGTYTVRASIAESGNLTAASADMTLTISPKNVTDPTITLSPASYEYDGTAKKPAVTVMDGSTKIDPGEYTVEYSNNTNVGSAAVVKITDSNAAGNYVISEKSVNFAITEASISGATVQVSGTYTYTGSEQTPDPTVTLGDKTLVKDTDYTVSYSGNVNAGTATVTVTGKGNYKDSADEKFTIGKADLTVDGTGTASGSYGAKLSELKVEGLTVSLNGTPVSGSWALSGDTIPNVGDNSGYTATFTPDSGADNYNTLTAEVKLSITKVNYTGTTAVNTSGKYGAVRTYDLVDMLPDGFVLGTATTSDNTIFVGTPSVTGTTLNYELVNDAGNVGKTGTITIPVDSSTNYNAFNLTITVTVTNVVIPDLSINTISVTYTGSPVPDSSITGTATADGKSMETLNKSRKQRKKWYTRKKGGEETWDR